MEEKIIVGSLVNYKFTKENGIVKSFSQDGKIAFVVYHCGGEWERYEDFTGAATHIQDLTAGWKDAKGQPIPGPGEKEYKQILF